MRKFHNSIKGQLIQESVELFSIKSVLDVSVGRFGDLHHYERSSVEFVLGIDPCQKSLEEAESRLMKSNLNAELKLAKITDENIKILEGKKFSIVSCMFTLHYFFESENMLRNAMKNISESLFKGGFLIGTSIDGDKLLNFNKENEHYKIQKKFTQSKCLTSFGNKYNFHLIDNPKSGIYFDLNSSKNTEFLVDKNVFIGIAKDYNLKLIQLKEFSKYNYVHKKKFNIWETDISNMNFSFIFVKIK